jgi:Na+/melibiose symporter-like transporter
MMPLSLFSNPRFLAANLLTFLLYGALMGALYTIPFYVIQVRHYSPIEAGAIFLPLIVLMFFFSARVGAWIPKVGERVLLVAGAIFAGAGFAAFALLDELPSYALSILPGVLLLGAGMTLCVAPLSAAVMASVPENQTGIASAVNNAISRLAGLVAVSLLALVLAHGFESSLSRQLSHSDLSIEARAEILANDAHLHDTSIPSDLDPQKRAEAAVMFDRAFLAGFRAVMLACALSAWGGAVAVFVLLRRKTRSS